MKRQRIEKKEECIFADIPTDLYPLVMGNYTEEVDAFRQALTLRCLSHHFMRNTDFVLAQIRELGQPIANVLHHDRQLALLPRLTRLNLRWNGRITTSAMTQLASLTRITMSWGGSCSLAGLDKLSGLTSLSMRYKSKWHPEELCLLTGLRRLNLTGSIHARYEGTDFLAMTALTRLREVKTDGADYRFTHLTMLSMIDLRNLDKEAAVIAMSFGNLTSLRLRGSPLVHHQTGKPWFSLLSSLRRLELSYCSSMSDFTLPIGLTRLSLIGWMHPRERVQDNVLRGLTNLRRLNLRQSSCFTNNALLHVPQLEHLDLSFTNTIKGDALVGLASSLRHLNLKNCRSIRDAYLCQMTALTHLTVINTCRIGDAGIRPLTKLRTLLYGDGGTTTISDRCLSALTSLTSLEWTGTYLESNFLRPSLTSMTRLERLVITGIRGYVTGFPSFPALKSLSMPHLLLGRDQLLCCPMLTHIKCRGNETTVCGDFDHLARLQSLSLFYQSSSDCKASYPGLIKLRDRGIIVSSSL